MLHECRTTTDYRDFKTSTCPCGQIIHIQLAVVGFSQQLDPAKRSPRCPLLGTTCKRTVTNHSSISKCNGNSVCWIPRDILYHSSSGQLCEEHQDGNFIYITYDCINSGKTIELVYRLFPNIFHILSSFGGLG